jgi:RNA polymerase sigma-70 factor (ECF subfamily)
LADEATLLDRIRQYDQAALAQVYDDYYDRIYHYVYRFVGQVAAAEDLTANVFLRLLNAVRSGKQPHSNLLAWLYRVAHNLVVDSFRRAPGTEEVELTEWLEGYEPDLTHIVEQRLQLERVRRALLDLTPAQQQVIVLKFLEGLDSVEVAAILKKSEGAVDALQHRALLALREALRPPPSAGPDSPSRDGERAAEDTLPDVAPSGPTPLATALVRSAPSSASAVCSAHVSARPPSSAFARLVTTLCGWLQSVHHGTLAAASATAEPCEVCVARQSEHTRRERFLLAACCLLLPVRSSHEA